MNSDLLHRIQQQQFVDKSYAEKLLLTFLQDIFAPEAVKVQLQPIATSLNSFNGFVTLSGGRELFFKSHAEPDSVIAEYYNATELVQAGYPVIEPIFSSVQPGKQLLIYEVVTSPSVFDVAWEIEQGRCKPGALKTLTEAQNLADRQLFQIYRQTLAKQSAEKNAKAPVHQLFYHRLTQGRFNRFYGPLPGIEQGEQHDRMVLFPNGQHTVSDIWRVRWRINGQIYESSLDKIISDAIQLLNPATSTASIIGHGDAHNGNIFLISEKVPPRLIYFDPAFAGRHSPLLDLVKPIFHNVFAMWMYYPELKKETIKLHLTQNDDLWDVSYSYALPPVREMFFWSKIEHVLIPILKELKRVNLLPKNWRSFFKAALFCCPLLTMNLADRSKFSPEISLLGFTMSVEMGAESVGKRSFIDMALDTAEAAIRYI
jgi:hypothetical protein